jgi:hypothetical protein
MTRRLPFSPPYTAEDLPQLDVLHDLVGLGAEWRASSARAALAPDPDAALIEEIAFALYQEAGGQDSPRMSSATDRDRFVPKARKFLRVMRSLGF